MEVLELNPRPWWILATEGNGDISGQLRDATFREDVPIGVIDLLDEAAERLDDAHEEWMMNKLGLPNE